MDIINNVVLTMSCVLFIIGLSYFYVEEKFLSVIGFIKIQSLKRKTFYQMIDPVEGDEDMKILSDFSNKKNSTNEDEISQYFQHKQNGNIDTAKALGRHFSQLILNYNLDTHPDLWINLPLNVEPEYAEEQAKMMYVYIAETITKKMSSDSILCQMIISSLNNGISDSLPNFYRRMEDCRAYTLYKLCGSRKDVSNLPKYMGEVYAQILGFKDNDVLCQIGSLLYISLEEKCLEIFGSASYVDISIKKII